MTKQAIKQAQITQVVDDTKEYQELDRHIKDKGGHVKNISEHRSGRGLSVTYVIPISDD